MNSPTTPADIQGIAPEWEGRRAGEEGLGKEIEKLKDAIMAQHLIFHGWGRNFIVACATCHTQWPCETVRIVQSPKEDDE